MFQINELKKAHQIKDGKLTWERDSSDKYVNYFGAVLFAYGIFQLIPGHYRLATGKGKME